MTRGFKLAKLVAMARPRTVFRSLRVTPEFRAFVLDQLARLPQLRSKLMFGGVGLYSGESFFGIIAADELFFKVDNLTDRDPPLVRLDLSYDPFIGNPLGRYLKIAASRQF